MKGDLSVISDIVLVLDKIEAQALGTTTLTGSLNVRDEAMNKRGTRVVTMSVGDCGNDLERVTCQPRDAPYERITQYDITLSRNAYDSLLHLGRYANRWGTGQSKLAIGVI